jgi:hypothetical protein
MAKKAKAKEEVEDVIEEEPKEEPKKEVSEIIVQKEEELVESKKDEPKKEVVKAEKPASIPLAVSDDDDITYVKQMFQKQMIDSLDVDTLKKFVVECEGKSLKQKAEWIVKNKPVPSPDPSKSLPKGAPGGKSLGRYDPGYKFEFVDNRVKAK